MPDSSVLKVPAVKDVATFIYFADEAGEWTKSPVCTILADLFYLKVDTQFQMEVLTPGEMGKTHTARVVDVKEVISYERSGKYAKFAQVKRLILAEVQQ
jgi:hypothetical protein